jgi:hypothetical protein
MVKKSFVCPECKAQKINTAFESARGLGRHRQTAHGVPGKSASVAYRRRRAERGEIIPKEVSQPIHERVAPGPDIISYAVGRIESLCELIARDNGLPEREFMMKAAEYFIVLAKR